ncbi:MAG: bifunctional pantoate--beta-alanine ligase/(d)CMP kinase [Oscillatoriales cyanobacterium C42_A2020_001]|nr:bifunctional pantoate--beta-alanine ligase/(d)CMP kinase [Leptolyngbyaceae cyanobacterium C42_A2020_001]
MRLFTSIAGLQCYLNLQRFSQQRLESVSSPSVTPVNLPLEIGFVPTMGALHDGHLSLIQQARRENKIVVVSIFVNPLQFGPTEDFGRYPRMLETDQALCEQAEVDVLFVPSAEEMGVAVRRQQAEDRRQKTEVEGGQEWISGQVSEILSPHSPIHSPTPLLPIPPASLTQVLPPASMTAELCGRSRGGHFQGVATIVTKLLNVVQPTRAYFGQKDAQQLAIIRRLVADLNLPVEVVACPIVREPSGLALSSRNRYLTPEERSQAATIYQGLRQAEELFRSGERLSSNLVEAVKAALRAVPAIAPEYIELVDPITMETLNEINDTGLLAVAARLGSTRLIDNLLLSKRKPIVAIDGPAGAGKSTVARMVAQALGLFYLDTGSMYRAITWLVVQAGVALNDEPAIAELLSRSQIEFRSQESEDKNRVSPFPLVFVNGQDVTQAIRSLEVTSNVSTIAAQPFVREQLVKQQQAYGQQGGIVVEGRDIGTHVFPDAELKIFLTASVQERARRRQKDLQNRGIGEVALDELEQAISDRDRKDSTRLIAPLRKAVDAIELNTDGLSIDQVCTHIVSLYHERLR